MLFKKKRDDGAHIFCRARQRRILKGGRVASKPFISAAWNRNEREAPRCAIGVAESKCELWGALRGSCLSKSWMEQASVNRSAGLDISLGKERFCKNLTPDQIQGGLGGCPKGLEPISATKSNIADRMPIHLMTSSRVCPGSLSHCEVYVALQLCVSPYVDRIQRGLQPPSL